MPTTTLFVDLGSGLEAVYAVGELDQVKATLSNSGSVACDSSLGEIEVMQGSVKFIQRGRRTLPVSAAPSESARSARQSHVTGS